MLEELRIKCPSCGIVLDVRNSRHEAVKRIVCPNCQKQLAVDFRDTLQKAESPKPLGTFYHGYQTLELWEGINQIPLPDCEYVQINVVRLNNGNVKCIVSPLMAEHLVKVNGQALQLNDKVVLAIGDELQTGETQLIYGKPGLGRGTHIQAEPKKARTTPSKPAINSNWLYATMVCIVVALIVIALWPSSDEPSPTDQLKGIVMKDTIDKRANVLKKTSFVKTKNKNAEKKDRIVERKRSDYDLEQQALKGDVEAQYELGNRLVRKNGSSNVIRGINYLHQASRNGSEKARIVMNKAISSLQRRADDGDSVAYRILMSIN